MAKSTCRKSGETSSGEEKPLYIYANDPLVKRRVPYVVKGKMAHSLVSRHYFKWDGKYVQPRVDELEGELLS